MVAAAVCTLLLLLLLQQQQSSQPAEASTSAPAAAAPEQSPVKREFTALGSKVVETNVPFKGPEDEQDFWEGEKFDGESSHNRCWATRKWWCASGP
jgi:hypothetical protein